MTVSILLLLILQALWLQNSYEKAFFDLRRDGNYLFRNTLFSIRDSLFFKNVQAVPDSLPSNIESLRVFKKGNVDSMQVSMRSSTVQVFVKGSAQNNDSIIEALRPMAQHFSYKAQDGKKFVIQLAPDTVSTDTLKKVFTGALEKAGLPLSFILQHEFSTPDKGPSFRMRLEAAPFESTSVADNLYRDTMKLETVRLNPMSRYSASLIDFKGFILKAIAPQILFSVLLTAITVIAFIVLYKNLRSQQRLMELKNDFISNVTHELKTPVATVSVALEALKNFNGLDNPTLTKEYLEIAQSELNRLTLMTDKILKGGAFENKDVVIQKESVNIDGITQEILNSMKLLFEKNKAQVTFQKEGDHFVIHGEPSHLTNVIYNLIDNALKYSPQQAHIRVFLKETPDQISLSVEDNGLGIPSQYKKKIFEKFFRVPTGDIHNTKGYGLGLSYVSSVVKAHEGNIEVESEPGKGSIFTITFPRHLHG